MVSFLADDKGTSNVGNVMKALSHLGLAKDDQIGICLRNSVESLPENHRRNIIRLSVIPGSFTLDAARNILDYRKRDIVSLQFDLQTLKYRGLLESEKDDATGSVSYHQPSTKDLRYKMHLLLRSFIVHLAKASDGELATVYKDAERRYVTYYGKRLRRLTRRLQEDFSDAFVKLQDDQANYMQFLEMLKSSDLEEYQSPEITWWVFLAVELLYFPKDRLKFYHILAEEAKNRGDMIGFANNTSQEVIQFLELGYDPEILLGKLQEVEDTLSQLRGKNEERKRRMCLATCYCVRGDVLTRYQRATEAIPWLEQAVEMRRDILGPNHLLIGRALNSLGTAVQTKAVLDPGPSLLHIQSEKKMAMKYFMEVRSLFPWC